MIKFFRQKKAQSTLEYVVVITVILASFLAIQTYFKRAMQGRWKEAVDDMGDQYDPQGTNGLIVHTLISNTVTKIEALQFGNSYYTSRKDTTTSIDSTNSHTDIFGY